MEIADIKKVLIGVRFFIAIVSTKEICHSHEGGNPESLVVQLYLYLFLRQHFVTVNFKTN